MSGVVFQSATRRVALYPDGEADRDHCPYRGHESRLGVGLPHHGVDTGEQHNRHLRE